MTILIGILTGLAKVAVAGITAAWAFLHLKGMLILGAIAAIAIGGYSYFGGEPIVLKQFSQPRLGFFDTFWKEKTEVKILIDGAFKDAVITPPSVNIQAGQWIAIELMGEEVVLQMPKYAGDLSTINPVEVIKFVIPGKKDGEKEVKKEFRLSNSKVTEFEVEESGELVFGLRYFYKNPSTFHSGTIKGDFHTTLPLKLRVVYLSTPSGKGSPPREIKKIQDEIKDIGEKIKEFFDGIPGLPETIVPDPEKVKEKIDKIREKAEEYWLDDPDGQDIQEKLDTMQNWVEEAEDYVSKKVEKLPEKYKAWQENKPKIR